MGEERGGLWGSSRGTIRERVLQKEAEEWPKVQRGSRLGELAPHRSPPSTSCPRAREGLRPERQQGEEGPAKGRLAQKWRKKRVALVSKGRWRYRARRKGERKRGESSHGGPRGARLRERECVLAKQRVTGVHTERGGKSETGTAVLERWRAVNKGGS